MTFAPDTIKELAAYWVAQGGVNSGIVGDLAHQGRASYHNGQDVIEKYGRTTATDYTIRNERDREPYLTNASAGLDLGKLDGSLADLQKFSRWLVTRCQADATGYRDIRDVIYSPDGNVVMRWDNYAKALYHGGDGTGQGDDSHLWHTHISFPRDSEMRAKVALFQPYFEGVDMPGLPITLPAMPVAGSVKIPAGTDSIRLSDHVHYTVPSEATRPAYAVSLAAPNSGPGYLVDLNGDVAHFVRLAAVTFTPAASGDCAPLVKAAHDKGYSEAKSAASNAVAGI